MKTRKVSSLTFVEEAIEVLQAKQGKSNQRCLLPFLLAVDEAEIKALLVAFALQRKVSLPLLISTNKNLFKVKKRKKNY